MPKKRRATRPPAPQGIPPPPEGATPNPYFNPDDRVWVYQAEYGQWTSGTVILPPDGSSGSTMMPWIEVDGTWEQIPMRIEYVYGMQ